MSKYRIVFLGQQGVGKTSLVKSFFYDEFHSHTYPTVEDYFCKMLEFPNGSYHRVEVIDTAGEHEFPAMRELNIKKGDAFVIVFAINETNSLLEAIRFRREIQKNKGKDFKKVILVGNKIDLRPADGVSTETGFLKALEDDCLFTETSAKLKCNVHCLFTLLMDIMSGNKFTCI